MRSTLTARGQTVVPAEIRRKFHLTQADRLEWIIENKKTIGVKSIDKALNWH